MQYIDKGVKFICNCGTELYELNQTIYENMPMSANHMTAIAPQEEAINNQAIICHKCGDKSGSCLANFRYYFQKYSKTKR
jgi:hypothetical protein